MFSGIVEAKVNLLEYTPDLPNTPTTIQIIVEKPSSFSDLSIGDSIALNGVCLTLEVITETSLQFSLGMETIKICGFSEKQLRERPINLERSLRFNDRIHGHIVTGHVDGMGVVRTLVDHGGCRIFQIGVPDQLLSFIWKKGSICLNGVSLTVNEVHGDIIEVCLIPETLRRTNLADIAVGSQVTLEVDQMARGISRILKLGRQNSELNT